MLPAGQREPDLAPAGFAWSRRHRRGCRTGGRGRRARGRRSACQLIGPGCGHGRRLRGRRDGEQPQRDEAAAESDRRQAQHGEPFRERRVSTTGARAASLPRPSLSSSRVRRQSVGMPERPRQGVVEQHPPGPHVVDVDRARGSTSRRCGPRTRSRSGVRRPGPATAPGPGSALPRPAAARPPAGRAWHARSARRRRASSPRVDPAEITDSRPGRPTHVAPGVVGVEGLVEAVEQPRDPAELGAHLGARPRGRSPGRGRGSRRRAPRAPSSRKVAPRSTQPRAKSSGPGCAARRTPAGRSRARRRRPRPARASSAPPRGRRRAAAGRPRPRWRPRRRAGAARRRRGGRSRRSRPLGLGSQWTS